MFIELIRFDKIDIRNYSFCNFDSVEFDIKGSGRSPAKQAKHDQDVRRIADDYKLIGYAVQAEASGYPLPDLIGGYRPDVRVKLELIGFEVVIEVETPDSIDTDHAKQQDAAFSNWARQDTENRIYRRIIIS